jgi:hypothetical protein
VLADPLRVDFRARADARPALRATAERSAAVLFRALARPPLRPAAAAVDFLRVVRPLVVRPVVLRVVVFRPVDFRPVDFRAVLLRPVVFRVVVFRAVDFFRVPVDFRVDFLRVLRAVALPPLRPAATTDGARRVVFLRVVLRPVVDRLRVPVLLRVVDFFRVPVDLRVPVVLRAVDLRVVDFFRVPVDLRVPVVLRAVVFRPVVFFREEEDFLVPVDFRVPEVPAVFRVVVFLRVVFLRTGLRVDKPDSVPKMSDPAPDVPVSITRVVGLNPASSLVTVTPSSSAPVGG